MCSMERCKCIENFFSLFKKLFIETILQDDILEELCLLLPSANEKILDSNTTTLFPDEIFQPVTVEDLCVCVSYFNNCTEYFLIVSRCIVVLYIITKHTKM